MNNAVSLTTTYSKMENNSSNTKSIYLSNSDSSQCSDSESFCSLENEIVKKKKLDFQNLEQFELISSSLTSKYNAMINKDETPESYSKYFNAPQKLQTDNITNKAAKLKYEMEVKEMKKNVRDLEKKLNFIISRNQIISDELLNLRKKKNVTEEALCIAKKYYSSVWGINISIENAFEDKFTCIVNFGFAGGLYPLKFLIDRNSRFVLNWDGSSLLTADEEREMKERFSGVENYFPQVLSELRLITLSKINSSY